MIPHSLLSRKRGNTAVLRAGKGESASRKVGPKLPCETRRRMTFQDCRQPDGPIYGAATDLVLRPDRI